MWQKGLLTSLLNYSLSSVLVPGRGAREQPGSWFVGGDFVEGDFATLTTQILRRTERTEGKCKDRWSLSVSRIRPMFTSTARALTSTFCGLPAAGKPSASRAERW